MAALNIVLLRASSLLLCMALVCVSAEPDEDPDQIVEFSETTFNAINDYFVRNAPDKVYFRKINVPLFQQYRNSPEFAEAESDELRKVADLLASLKDEKALCEPENLRAVRRIVKGFEKLHPEIKVKATVKKDKNGHHVETCLDKPHFSCALVYYLGYVPSDCLKPFDEAVEKAVAAYENDPTSDQVWQLLPKEAELYLKHFDAVNLKAVPSKYKRASSDHIKMLYGALNYLDSSIVDKDLGQVIHIILAKINYEMTQRPSLAGQAETGEPVSPDKETSAYYFQRYLIEPCERMLKSEQIKSLLTVIYYADSVDLVSLKPKGEAKYDETAYLWAARALNCNWLRKLDKDKLLEFIVAAEPFDNESLTWYESFVVGALKRFYGTD